MMEIKVWNLGAAFHFPLPHWIKTFQWRSSRNSSQFFVMSVFATCRKILKTQIHLQLLANEWAAGSHQETSRMTSRQPFHFCSFQEFFRNTFFFIWFNECHIECSYSSVFLSLGASLRESRNNKRSISRSSYVLLFFACLIVFGPFRFIFWYIFPTRNN